MIRVEGQDPTTLWRRLYHHAPELIPLAHATIDAIVFGPLGRADDIHVLRQHKAGANSFSLSTADGRSYHFRSYDYRTIEVFDRFKQGNRLARIATPDEAQAFVDHLDGNAGP